MKYILWVISGHINLFHEKKREKTKVTTGCSCHISMQEVFFFLSQPQCHFHLDLYYPQKCNRIKEDVQDKISYLNIVYL